MGYCKTMMPKTKSENNSNRTFSPFSMPGGVCVCRKIHVHYYLYLCFLFHGKIFFWCLIHFNTNILKLFMCLVGVQYSAQKGILKIITIEKQ